MTFDQGGADQPPQLPDAESPTAGPTPAAPELGVPGPPARRPNRVRAGLVVGGLAGIGALAVKVAIGLFVVSVAGHVLGAVFGGPYQRLPENVRSGFEQRLNAAFGNQLDGLSDADKTARVEAMLRGGLPRLDDATLVTDLRLVTLAMDKADVATCAAATRSSFAGAKTTADVSNKVAGGLDDASLSQFFEIQVEAIEAEAHKSPAARTVTSAEAESALTTVVQAMPAADLSTAQSLSSAATVPDPAACSVERSFLRAALALAPADRALMARFIVSP